MGLYKGSYSSYPPGAPIPVIQGVTFNEPLAKISFSGDALIDTGADLSNIPRRIVGQHRISIRDYVSVKWPDGSTKTCNVYYLEVCVSGLAPLIERFIDYGFDEIILGRPILNSWRIVLDPFHKNPAGSEIEIED